MDDVRGLLLGMPHGTTPAAVTTNKNVIVSSFKSSGDIIKHWIIPVIPVMPSCVGYSHPYQVVKTCNAVKPVFSDHIKQDIFWLFRQVVANCCMKAHA